MKKWIYWCVTSLGFRWLDSQYQLDQNNQKQMEWVYREIGECWLMVEMPQNKKHPLWMKTIDELFSFIKMKLQENT